MNRLVAAALAVNQDNLALGNEVFAIPGGRVIRNVDASFIHDANYVDNITASTPAEIDALLARSAAELAHCPFLIFHVDARTPPEFEARLVLDSFARSDALISVLEGDLTGVPKPFDIRPIVDAEAWAAFELLEALNWAGNRARDGDEPQIEIGRSMAARNRAKSPPVRHWLGYVGGVPQGFLNSWEGTEGVGQVETLFVRPELRHRGLATALLHHCVADCRAHGAGPVVIVADPNDTPKRMYAAMGWRPVALKRSYTRTT